MSEHHYRLGDMVKFNKTNNIYAICDDMIESFPNSIGGEYMKRSNLTNDFETLHNITQEKCQSIFSDNKHVMHIRLGDILCLQNDDGKKKPPKIEEIRNYLKDIPDHDISFLSGNHTGLCEQETQSYLDDLKKEFPRSHIHFNDEPDLDFCRMINAEVFIEGKGGFSEMVRKVREINGKSTISHFQVPELL